MILYYEGGTSATLRRRLLDVVRDALDECDLALRLLLAVGPEDGALVRVTLNNGGESV